VRDEDAGEQTPDAAEAVEHDVGGLGGAEDPERRGELGARPLEKG
jgi:hypothetical protein